MSCNPVVSLNLASRPAKNRRLYVAARSFLAGLIVVLLGLSVFSALNYGVRAAALRTSLAEVRKRMNENVRERTGLSTEIQKAKTAGQGRIDVINGIILRKSFSWTAFMSQIEAALPDSSYITAFDPEFSGDRAMTLRIRVVSRGLDDLLALIKNLYARQFTGIRVENESPVESGQLVSELTLIYERDY